MEIIISHDFQLKIAIIFENWTIQGAKTAFQGLKMGKNIKYEKKIISQNLTLPNDSS